ncbi:type VI secretion system tip protein VgrG [Corallincola holothuriorum]|uniref:Type VI secretion system tip protein VgrG n=1 Tax=Corallincola holothuriorum TaxID=2282215 RepID=A0A368NIY7_9GAMM|nr:type VI secretion system tip protein VgrG [Corallincola holothuriorum]RCU50557.1 type VI secretion system tip protein VgrG [Corallincola holothuriorum]
MPRTLPNTGDLITFTLKSDGVALSADYEVEMLDIRRHANKIASATLVLIDGDPARATFAHSSAATLVPGAEIEILVGYNSRETSLFKGILLRQQLKVTENGTSRLKVECRDGAFVMAQAAKSRYFQQLSDSGLFDRLLSDYSGLTLTAVNTQFTHPEIVQFRQSDWELMLQRVELNGLYIATEDGTVRISEVADEVNPIAVRYGIDVIECDFQLDARNQFSEVTCHAWLPADQQMTSATGTPVNFSAPGNIPQQALAQAAGNQPMSQTTSGSFAIEQLQSASNALVARQQLAKVQGTVTVQGVAAFQIGSWVELQGFGERFNGTAWVGGLRHVVSRGNWLTTLQVGMSPQPQTEHCLMPPTTKSPFATASAAGFVSGLQIGVVTQLQDDPMGEERILVKLPSIDANHDGIWCRLATLDAGDQRGVVCRPEIGDEVVVGLFDNDPHSAVVLGSLHSSGKAPPIAACDDNHEKGWTTRSGIAFTIDDEKASVMVATPAGNSLTISDDQSTIVVEDQHGNKITMEQAGISLSSAKDLTLSASGDIKLEATGIDIAANGEANLSGQAGTKVESSANTVVKGSLVQIN